MTKEIFSMYLEAYKFDTDREEELKQKLKSVVFSIIDTYDKNKKHETFIVASTNDLSEDAHRIILENCYPAYVDEESPEALFPLQSVFDDDDILNKFQVDDLTKLTEMFHTVKVDYLLLNNHE